MFNFNYSLVKQEIIRLQSILQFNYNYDNFLDMQIDKFLDIRKHLIEVQKEDHKQNAKSNSNASN